MNRDDDWFDDYRDRSDRDWDDRRKRREDDYNRYERDYFNSDDRRQSANEDYLARRSRLVSNKIDFEEYIDKSGEVPSNIVICYPKTYADIKVLIDSLRQGQPIIADLSKISDSSAQRILDFMSGAIYALQGSMHRINANLFLLTPTGMSIKIPIELKDKLERK